MKTGLLSLTHLRIKRMQLKLISKANSYGIAILKKKESQIVFQRDGVVDWNDSADIEEIHKWCVENLLKLKTVFYPKITEAIQAHNS